MPKLLVPVLLAGVLLLAGCGPQAPQPGTPPFFWAAAKETFAAGDYTKTHDHLMHLVQSTNDFTARAMPWQLIVNAGLARGYIELADNFEKGSRATKTNPTPFRRQMNTYRSTANQLVLNFAERFDKFRGASQAATLPLDFPFPGGAVALPAALERVAGGALPPTGFEDLEQKTVARNMVLAVAAAAGSTEDAAKARELFKAGNAQVPRPAFMMAMASNLQVMGELYVRSKLSQPDHVKYFCDHAMEVLKDVPASDEVDKLKLKIEDTEKAK